MGTISVRYAWRARPNSAPDRPIAKDRAPSIHTLCASSAAGLRGRLHRCRDQGARAARCAPRVPPDGSAPASWPTPRRATVSAATPTERAELQRAPARASTGRTASWPSEASTAGLNAGTAIAQPEGLVGREGGHLAIVAAQRPPADTVPPPAADSSRAIGEGQRVSETFTVPARYCGPPESGAVTSGHLAALVRTTPEARPPGSGCARRRRSTARWLCVTRRRSGRGGRRRGRLPPPSRPRRPPARPAQRRSASPRHWPSPTTPGWTTTPSPTCFACGTAREPGDALCLRPGPLLGRGGEGVHAAAWVPAEATTEVVWAALDCLGRGRSGSAGARMVLGTRPRRSTTSPRSARSTW